MSDSKESTATMLEKLASSLEAFATTLETTPVNKPQMKVASASSEYGQLASSSNSYSAESNFKSWLGF